jgi:hypothetical protein
MMTVIIFLASLFSCLITYLATQDLFKKVNHDGTPKKKLAKKEMAFLICLALLVVLPVMQKIIQDRSDHKTEIANDLKTHKHDSIQQVVYDSSLLANTLKIKSDFDSTTNNQTKILSTTLGEYNLALDKANNRIVRLVKDSSKTRIIEPENPTLVIDSITLFKKILDNYVYHVWFKSHDATSRDFNIQASLLLGQYNFSNLTFINNYTPLDFSSTITKEGTTMGTIGVNTQSPFSYFILWLHGNYKNQDESKRFPISEMYYVGYPSGNNGTIKGATRQRAIDLVKANK